MPILGSSSSAANRDMIKNMNKWVYNYLIELKTLWDKEKLLITKTLWDKENCSLRAISHFSTLFSKAVCCRCIKMSICGINP